MIYNTGMQIFQKLSIPILLLSLIFSVGVMNVGAQEDLENTDNSTEVLENTEPCPEGTLCNPIAVNSIEEFIIKILKIFMTIGIPVITLFIIYTGYLFVTAEGDPGKLKIARSSLLWTVVGALVILGSYVLAQAIAGTVKEIINA